MMKNNAMKRKPNYNKKPKKNQAEFLKKNPKRAKKDEFFINEEEIVSDVSGDEDDGDFFSDDSGSGSGGDNEEKMEEDRETVEETRLKLAKRFVDKVRNSQLEKEIEDDEDDVDDREEKDGARDSLVTNLLMQEQLEDSGRTRRLIASKVQKPETEEEPRLLLKHRQSVTAVALSYDDSRGFSVSKDGRVNHWDVETGQVEKYSWPTDDVLKSHGVRDPRGRAKKHSKQMYALAVSSDGRYLSVGGSDGHIHLWDVRSKEHIKAFSGHKKLVSGLAFREGTSELFSSSFDREPKIWNVEDRTYIGSLLGHENEVLSIDCLRKERVLTAGRDRRMCYWKVPEESHLVFRSSTSSLECCCLIGNDEFLSGSDDGSVQLWSVTRKKPVYIAKNAHPIPTVKKHVYFDNNGEIANGHPEGDAPEVLAPSSTSRSWVGAVSVCRNSDFAASGAGNGFVRLWGIQSDGKDLRPLFSVPVEGYVNSLAIAKSGRFLVAGVGQEPRLGRWDRISSARNGVVLQSFNLTS